LSQVLSNPSFFGICLSEVLLPFFLSKFFMLSEVTTRSLPNWDYVFFLIKFFMLSKIFMLSEVTNPPITSCC
jgi:hypothetical protein